MKIQIASPARPGFPGGNNVTAHRWAGLLRQLGHEVAVTAMDPTDCDLLVALHARRSFPLIAQVRARAPTLPVFVALTGTDLYQDLPHSAEARQALEWATRILVLQPLAVDSLPAGQHGKVRVILQSAEPVERAEPDPTRFEVVVLGHLRPVKDPFRAAAAARLLPLTSRVTITQVGAALSPDYVERARREERENPRYRWLGELPRAEALQVLARSRLLALTSRSEGGANVVSEALAAGVPVVSSRIAGSVGVLGREYSGYYPVGDTQALAGLLGKAESDPVFYAELREHCAKLASLVAPERERAAWEALLRETVSAQRQPFRAANMP